MRGEGEGSACVTGREVGSVCEGGRGGGLDISHYPPLNLSVAQHLAHLPQPTLTSNFWTKWIFGNSFML